MINPDFTFWIQAVNFFLLMIILNYLFFKPILKVADDRARKIAELKQGARQAAKSGEKALAEYEKRLADMRRESSETVAESRKEAAQASSAIIDKAQEEFSIKLAASREELNQQVDEATASLKDEMAGLAGTLAQNILGRKV